jgi:aryl-alcohol dehydrogenase-like predicted oxidoreductase
VDKLEEIAGRHDKEIAQVALAWLLANPVVSAPIVGANSLEQLRASLGAVGLRLDAEEKQALDELSAWQEP